MPRTKVPPRRANPTEVSAPPPWFANGLQSFPVTTADREGLSTTDPPTYAEYKNDQYLGYILKGTSMARPRLMVGIPSTGSVRMEWSLARNGQMIPTNWSSIDYVSWMNQVTPLGYNVADARNLIVHVAVSNDFRWLLFIDSDVILPADTFYKLNDYVRKGDIPIVFGLYTTKSHPPEPLVYRDVGDSYFRDFKLGDKFWVSGIGMGCTLINVDVLKLMSEDAPYYLANGQHRIKRVFDTPQVQWLDPETKTNHRWGGTEDIAWCTRVKEGEYLKRAGFPKVGRQKYQMYCDSSIFCGHIREDGVVFPLVAQW